MYSINLRVNEDLKAAINAAAEHEGLPVASFIKAMLTRELRERGFLEKKKAAKK